MNTVDDNMDSTAGWEQTRGGDLVDWLWIVFCWDGVLPVIILMSPQVALKLGAEPDTAEFVAIVTPIAAFFVRVVLGFRRMARNRCGPVLRFFQFAVFLFAAVLLVCIDTLMLLAMEMNNGRLWANRGDMIAMLILMGAYFTAMLFAFYPGRSMELSRANINMDDNDLWSD
jgi:hypothetical protein